jgi:hypothetical protein
MDTCIIQSLAWVEQSHALVGHWITESAPWAQVIQALASIIGFFVLFFQVLHLRNNIRGATHDRLYAHYNDVCKEMMKKPSLYPYFYAEQKHVGSASSGRNEFADDRNEPAELEIMSEMIWGVIEHSKVQEKNLPLDSWTNCWLPYALERIDKSPAVYEYFKKNNEWYTPAVTAVFCEFERYKKDKKQYLLEINSHKTSMIAMRKTVLIAIVTIAIFMVVMVTLGSTSFMCGA